MDSQKFPVGFSMPALPSPLFLTTLALLLNTYPVSAATLLKLDDYIQQVKTGNTAVKSSALLTETGQQRSAEGTTALAPTLYANFSYTVDAKLQQVNFMGYDSQIYQNFTLGVSQNTTFGLSAKLHYDISTQSYVNPQVLFSIPGMSGSFVPLRYAMASPTLELTQSLWSNGFGRSTQAHQEQLEAAALASSYGASYQTKATVSQAEMAYWRLALARQIILVQQQAVDRAQKIFTWNEKRARLQLTDQADVLQAETTLRSRELDLTSSQNELRAASRAFNSIRNIDSTEVTEELLPFDPSMIDELRTPTRGQFRDDVKAALQSSRATRASAQLSKEKNQPTLDIFATLSLNGQAPASAGLAGGGFSLYQNVSDAIAASFTFNRPTETIGVRFSTPLNFGTLADARDAWAKEAVAAEMTYDRKLFEQEQDWKDLTENLADSKKQLELSRKLELLQKAKLESEKDRLQRGRTTTYQVLMFEQEYLFSQLTRIRNQATVLNLIARMKLFGETL